MPTRRAACNCGQLPLTCEGEPVRISTCHCLECQRRTGAVGGVAGLVRVGNGIFAVVHPVEPRGVTAWAKSPPTRAQIFPPRLAILPTLRALFFRRQFPQFGADRLERTILVLFGRESVHERAL